MWIKKNKEKIGAILWVASAVGCCFAAFGSPSYLAYTVGVWAALAVLWCPKPAACRNK